MVDTSRRRLLAGVTLAALTGCVGDTSTDETETESPTTTESTPESGESQQTTTPAESDSEGTDPSVPSSVLAALDPIPDTVGENSVSRIVLMSPGEQQSPVAAIGSVSAEELGVESDAIDRVAVAYYGSPDTTIISVVGSFDADEPTLPDESINKAAVYREDGLLLAAGKGNEVWDAGIEAAKDAIDDEMAYGDGIRAGLARASGQQFTMVIPDMDRDVNIPEGDVDGLSSMVVGGTQDEDQLSYRFVGIFESESAVDTGAFESFIADSNITIADDSVRREGRLVTLSATTNTETSNTRGPNLHVFGRYLPEEGVAELEFDASEPVETDRLTLYVDDERVDGVWETDQLDGEHIVTVETAPISTVRVEWDDPEEDEPVTVTREVIVPHGRFRTEYDADADQATFTYVGQDPIEKTDLIRIHHRTEDDEYPDEDDGEPLADRYSTLSEGDEVVIDGVAFGDIVSLHVTQEWENGSSSMSLASVRASPPGAFSLDQTDEPMVVFSADQPQSAANYRVTVGGEEQSTQFSDRGDRIADGDELPVDGEPGQEVQVQWVGDDNTVTLLKERLEPPAEFELRRMNGEINLVYTASESMDASQFVIRTGSGEERSLGEEFDTLSQGDALPLGDGFERHLSVRWTAPEEPIFVYHGSIEQLLQFEFGSSDDQVSLVYSGDGSWPASDIAVEVGGERVPGFASEYDTISTGDSIELDAELGTRIKVVWTNGAEPVSVFEENLHPPFEFEFEEEDSGTLTVTWTSETSIDAEALGVTVHGSSETSYPDIWADEYDTVEEGDSVTVEIPDEFEAVVVHHSEWRTWDVYENEQ